MKISRYEWWQLSFYIIGLLVVTSIPYVIAQQQAGDTWLFNGFMFGVEDGNAYLGKIRLGVEGNWRFYLFYTPGADDDKASLLYLPYLLAGHAVRLLIDEQDPQQRFEAMVLAFHLLRMISSVLLLVAIYVFSAYFLRSRSARFLALVMASIGGGVGWVFGFMGRGEWLGSPPPDFFIPEAFGFLVIFGLPHIAMARAALLAGFCCLFQAIRPQTPRHQQPRWALLAGLCWVLVGLGVAFYLVIIYCIVLAWGAATWARQRTLPWQLIRPASIAVIITWPLFFYFVWLFTFNEPFTSWSAQNLLPSPHPVVFALAYIFFIPLAILGGWWHWRNRPQAPALLLVGWVLVAPILVYLPLNVQRRLSEAVIVPLSILSVAGLQLLTIKLPGQSYSKRWRSTRTLWLVPATLTTALILVGSSFAPLSPGRPLFRPQAEIAAMDWLASRATANETVLGAPSTGNLLAARHDIQVYLGHGPETIGSDEREEQIERFFGDQLSSTEQAQLLADVNYVFYGTAERELEDDTLQPNEPDWATNLRLIYDQDDYQIFEVPQ